MTLNKDFFWGAFTASLISFVGLTFLDKCNSSRSLENQVKKDSVSVRELTSLEKYYDSLVAVKKLTSLEKYNLENAKVYSDFENFVMTNPNKKEYAQSQYFIKFSNNKYTVDFTEKGYGHGSLFVWTGKSNKNFFDWGKVGLDNDDSFSYMDTNTDLIEAKRMNELSSEKQLESAKEYTETQKRIMHDANYKTY